MCQKKVKSKFSVVYTKKEQSDVPSATSSKNIMSNYWDNNSIQIRSSAKIESYPKLSSIYINAGNVVRTPSIDEIIDNRVRIANYKKGLLQEKKC